MNRNRAFTLIELMVVIAILFLLFVMLVPAIVKAKSMIWTEVVVVKHEIIGDENKGSYAPGSQYKITVNDKNGKSREFKFDDLMGAWEHLGDARKLKYKTKSVGDFDSLVVIERWDRPKYNLRKENDLRKEQDDWSSKSSAAQSATQKSEGKTSDDWSSDNSNWGKTNW